LSQAEGRGRTAFDRSRGTAKKVKFLKREAGYKVFGELCCSCTAENPEFVVIVLTHPAIARRRRLPTLTNYEASGRSLTVEYGIGRDTLAAPLELMMSLRRYLFGLGFWLFWDLGLVFGLDRG
jgi:hypothetical protein